LHREQTDVPVVDEVVVVVPSASLGGALQPPSSKSPLKSIAVKRLPSNVFTQITPEKISRKGNAETAPLRL
jgi:hypothetical protein